MNENTSNVNLNVNILPFTKVSDKEYLDSIEYMEQEMVMNFMIAQIEANKWKTWLDAVKRWKSQSSEEVSDKTENELFKYLENEVCDKQTAATSLLHARNSFTYRRQQIEKTDQD